MTKSIKLRLSTLILILFLPLASCKKQPDKELSYEGISFKYPSYWKVKTEKGAEGGVYIDAEERFSSETIFFVSVSPFEIDHEEMLENYFSKLSQDFDVTKEPATSGKFGQYRSSSVKYTMSKNREKAYGIIYAFDAEERTVLIIKQSNREYELKHEKYKLMEDSFKVEEPIKDSIE